MSECEAPQAAEGEFDDEDGDEDEDEDDEEDEEQALQRTKRATQRTRREAGGPKEGESVPALSAEERTVSCSWSLL